MMVKSNSMNSPLLLVSLYLRWVFFFFSFNLGGILEGSKYSNQSHVIFVCFLAALDLHCFARASSSCGSGAYSSL